MTRVNPPASPAIVRASGVCIACDSTFCDELVVRYRDSATPSGWALLELRHLRPGRDSAPRANMRSMTSQGSPYGRFRRALATGNVAIIDAAARELPTLNLRDALSILVAMGRAQDPRYPRAAARWAARATSEWHLDVDAARRILALVEVLPRAPDAISEELAAICRR